VPHSEFEATFYNPSFATSIGRRAVKRLVKQCHWEETPYSKTGNVLE